MRWSLDALASSVRIRTHTAGLLARFAHDLELAASAMSGWVEQVDDGWTSELEFPVASLAVVGVIRGGVVDRSVLSVNDVIEIERKLRSEVLRGASVRVRGRGDQRLAEVAVEAPRGTSTVTAALTHGSHEGDRRSVEGKARLSLSKLGCPEVKGPLGAFKVSDEVEVLARLVFRN